jgi:hypothetical protein
MDFHRYTWLALVDEMITGPAGTRYFSALPDVPARARFESSTGSCQQDIDKYCRFRWLAFLDTYRTMCAAPDLTFQRVFEELRMMRLAA